MKELEEIKKELIPLNMYKGKHTLTLFSSIAKDLISYCRTPNNSLSVDFGSSPFSPNNAQNHFQNRKCCSFHLKEFDNLFFTFKF
jgi:hypothetical protein